MTEAEVRFRVFEKVVEGLEGIPFSAVVLRAKMSHALTEIILYGNSYEAEEIIKLISESAE